MDSEEKKSICMKKQQQKQQQQNVCDVAIIIIIFPTSYSLRLVHIKEWCINYFAVPGLFGRHKRGIMSSSYGNEWKGN